MEYKSLLNVLGQLGRIAPCNRLRAFESFPGQLSAVAIVTVLFFDRSGSLISEFRIGEMLNRLQAANFKTHHNLKFLTASLDVAQGTIAIAKQMQSLAMLRIGR
jgi:hypothetical protein